MDLNKILKIILIISILIITASIAYYCVIFLPKNKQAEIEFQKQQKLIALKLQFIKECENKYDELQASWQAKEQAFREKVIDAQTKRCEIVKNTTEADFDIEQWWYCWNGQLVFYSKEGFAKPCVRFKFNQLNILNEF